MIQQKALIIDAAKKEWNVETITDERILGPVDFGFYMNQKEDYFCIGAGALAGSLVPGTHRLIISGKSPIWGTFYISTMGGAAINFAKLGVDYIAIKNAYEQYCVLRITNYDGKLSVSFDPIEDIHKIWKGDDKHKGVFAMQKYVLDKCKGEGTNKLRAIVAGPASLYSSIGALGSSVLTKDFELTSVECWAGRGGLGSKLVQQHNIVGIVFGGDYQKDGKLRDLKLINDIFEK